MKSRIAIASEFPRIKTEAALKVACSLAKPDKILILDSEYKAEECAEAFPVKIHPISSSSPEDVISLLKEMSGKYEVIVCDSLSDVWNYCLDLHKQNEGKDIKGLRSWARITPKWDGLLSVIKRLPCHFISTWQMKDYIVPEGKEVVNKGKKVVGKHGNKGLKQNYQMILMLNEDSRSMLLKDDLGIFPDWKESRAIDEGILKKISEKYKVK